MVATDGLGEHPGRVDALDLVARGHPGILRDGVRGHDGLEGGVPDPAQGLACEDAVRHDGIDLGRAGLAQLLGRLADRHARVGHVVDHDGNVVIDVADEGHGGELVALPPHVVDDGEVDVELVGDGRHAFGAAGVRRHDHGRVPVVDVRLDPVNDLRLGIQVVDLKIRILISFGSRNFFY